MDSGNIETDDVRSLGMILQNESAKQDNNTLEKYNKEIFTTMLPAIVYTNVMIILGLPGNIIVFYIYLFKWRKSTSRIFILFLAALDTMNCSINLPMEIYIMWNSVKLDQPVLCKISRYSTYVMNSSSALILVGIAADRFKRICRPYQRAFSEAQSMNICIAAILWSMATTWPSLILYGTRTITLGNVKGLACLLENKYDTSPYPLAYFIFMITTTMMTFVILIFLYYLVGLQIYQHRKFKLQHCTHVQKIVDDKSITVKTDNSNGKKLNSPNNDLKSGKEELYTNYDNGVIDMKDESNILKEDNEDKLKPYQLGLPPPCKDVGTSCGLLDIPCQQEDGHHGSDLTVSDESKATFEHSFNDSKFNELPMSTKQSLESKPQNIKEKKQRRRVRYLLVRGASILNASGQSSSVKCLTVRIGRSTLMLFLITIAYVHVISFLPFYILVIVRQLDSNFVQRMSTSGLGAYHLFIRSYLLSSAVNPFIYSFCNVQFREYCKETFVRIFYRGQQSLINQLNNTRRKY